MDKYYEIPMNENITLTANEMQIRCDLKNNKHKLHIKPKVQCGLNLKINIKLQIADSIIPIIKNRYKINYHMKAIK